ncbi:MAG: twin-arginine translocase TatA/TatE family subunit [Actinomycetota bacterium]|nr:twin-arginine translocase TatA/TatE family subunit [Actinomycetota bacterium]
MGLGMTEVLFILLIALIIFGPRRLPELGRSMGKFIREFKRAAYQIENQIKMEFIQAELEEKRAAEKAAEEVSQAEGSDG